MLRIESEPPTIRNYSIILATPFIIVGALYNSRGSGITVRELSIKGNRRHSILHMGGNYS